MSTPKEIQIARRLAKTYDSAKQRGKEFNLTMSYMANILEQTHCAYSGEKFSENRMDEDMLTLERWDNDKGYVIGNVVPVKKKYNNLRGDHTLRELRAAATLKSQQIVRAVKPKVAPKGSLKEQQNIRTRLKANIITRQKHLAELLALPELNEHNRVVIQSLGVRIKGSEAELHRVENLIKALEAHQKPVSKLSTAESAVIGYDIIATALERLEKRSKLDMMKLNKGLPLNASLIQLIRGKMQ